MAAIPPPGIAHNPQPHRYPGMLSPEHVNNCEIEIRKGKRWMAIGLLIAALPIVAITVNALGFTGHLSGGALCTLNLVLTGVSVISFSCFMGYNVGDRAVMMAAVALLVAGFIIANSLCLAGKIDYSLIPWLTFGTPMIGLMVGMLVVGGVTFGLHFRSKRAHEKELKEHDQAQQAAQFVRQSEQQAAQLQREAELVLNKESRYKLLRGKLTAFELAKSVGDHIKSLDQDIAALKAAFVRDYGQDAFNECARQAQQYVDQGKAVFAAAAANDERG